MKAQFKVSEIHRLITTLLAVSFLPLTFSRRFDSAALVITLGVFVIQRSTKKAFLHQCVYTVYTMKSWMFFILKSYLNFCSQALNKSLSFIQLRL